MGVVTNNLGRILSEMSNLSFEAFSFIRLFDFIQIDTIFVGKGIENIHTFDCILASLLETVNQIYPAIQMLTDISTFQTTT